jgi:hypothetical protein
MTLQNINNVPAGTLGLKTLAQDCAPKSLKSVPAGTSRDAYNHVGTEIARRVNKETLFEATCTAPLYQESGGEMFL